MYRLMTAALNGLWTLGLLGSLAVGVQAVGDNRRPSEDATRAAERSIDEAARLAEENRNLKRQLVEAAAQAQKAQGASQPLPATTQPSRPQGVDDQDRQGTATALTYGPDGTFITLEEYYRLHPGADPRYRSGRPRPKWRYRPPTCTPSRAQIAWARMLPNHDGLASRGLSDEEIVTFFAPSEVKALDGDEVPEHLRPDLNPQVVSINERCADGTCRTGYCEASRKNSSCKDGACPVPGR